MNEVIEKPVTPDDVWKILREVAEMSKETDRRFLETDKRFQETNRRLEQMSKEAERRSQEMDRRFQETDRELRDGFRETREVIKRVSEKIGNLGGRLGQFVQEMVRPAVVRLFQQRGIEVHAVHSNIDVKRHGFAAEIDLLVVNDGVAIAVECKSNCSNSDVDDHLKRLEKLKELLPEYQSLQLMGAMAAMVMPDSVARYAYKRGLYVLAQSGDAVLVLNDDKFIPKTW